jgi:Poxvirus Late Transcription Factor VLTF3 like
MLSKKNKGENNKKKKTEDKSVYMSISSIYEEETKRLKGQELIDYLLKTSFIVNCGDIDSIEKRQDYSEAMNETSVVEKPVSNNYCENCGKTNTFEKNSIYCLDCGISLDTQKYEYQRNSFVHKKFDYKRINYFKEWIIKIQSKENKCIPAEIFEKIDLELKKYGKNFSDLNYMRLRKILKKIGHPEYYENIYLIINITNKRKRIEIPEDIQNKLYVMFSMIQDPFEAHKGTRKSFLSYAYTLYKFFEILGYNEFLFCFPLLKSKIKLYEHDRIWKKICKDTGFPYTDTEVL